MKILVNGSSIDVGEKATVSDVLSGQPYRPGSAIALSRSVEEIRKETSEYEVQTNKGAFVIHIDDGPFLAIWRDIYHTIKDRPVRWQTSKVTAIGSFPTDLRSSREPWKFTRYDCFFALGGYDNRTSYLMIARQDHIASYGVERPVFGRVTRGRHVLENIEETDRVIDIRPVIMELRSKDAFATTDLTTPLEEGMSVETFVEVKLDPRSPVSVEHFLVAAEKGVIKITDKTESYTACSTRMDVNLIEEAHGIRDENIVTVRHAGPGMGRIYFYHTKRQTNVNHNLIGRLTNGLNLVHLVEPGGSVTVIPDPMRVMVVGMTQKDAKEYLGSRGLVQNRTGDVSDDAIIVEQEPELTVHAMEDKTIDTFGASSDKMTYWYLYRDKAPTTSRYIEKMTGTDHKPIGALKVHFTFEGMPMVTFEGDDGLGARLVPEPSFEGTCRRGDIGVTNMSRPHRGLIGIRLQDSTEFGPTGEEQHGTNIVGRFVGDIDRMMSGLKDGDIVYVRETDTNPDEAVKVKEPRKKTAAAETEKGKALKKTKTTKGTGVKRKEAKE